MAVKAKPSKVRSPRPRWFIRVAVVVLVVILATFSWAGFRWLKFIEKHEGEPYRLGVSFSLKYARELGVDWQSTFTALMDEMGVRRFRLMSYWDDIERVRGEYRFEQLDWQFREAEAKGAKVSLAIGLRQPRWPECHSPEWAKELERNNYSEWRRELDEFIVAVVNRYKDSPALVSWQLENEALNTAFGICHDHDRQRLEDEFQLVKKHDQRVPVMVSVSNEFGLPLGKPKGDIVGFSVYKRVFENRFLKTYFNYPLPARWHGVRAAIVERYLDQPVVIHELQAEPWGPDQTWNLSIEEQNKSMDAKRVKKHADYAMRSGIREMYFWGGEWWYWRKHKLGDPTVWETAKAIFAEQQS